VIPKTGNAQVVALRTAPSEVTAATVDWQIGDQPIMVGGVLYYATWLTARNGHRPLTISAASHQPLAFSHGGVVSFPARRLAARLGQPRD
jgi:hypothetical protein